jgi:hypothetical protein
MPYQGEPFQAPAFSNFLQELGFITLEGGQLVADTVYHLKTRLWARIGKALLPGIRLGKHHPIRQIGEIMGTDSKSPDHTLIGPNLAWLVADDLMALALDKDCPVDLSEPLSFFGLSLPTRAAERAKSKGRVSWREAFRLLGPLSLASTERAMDPFRTALEDASECVAATEAGYEAWTRWCEGNGGLFFALPRKEKPFYPAKREWAGRLAQQGTGVDQPERLVPSWWAAQNVHHVHYWTREEPPTFAYPEGTGWLKPM